MVSIALSLCIGVAAPAADAADGGPAPDAGVPAQASSQAAADGGATAAGLLPYPMDVRTLPNGLQVVMVPTGSGGLAAYFTLMRVGSRNEVEEGRSGFAHFFEHMMFRGTDAYPADKYNDLLRSVGMNGNAETTDDFTLFTTYGPTEALPQVITLEADRFQHLKYGKDAFKTEAKAVLGEYNKDSDAPEFAADEALHKAAFSKSTYRHTTMGFLRDIKRMPDEYAYSLQFFKRWYVPGNAVIFVVGDFAPDATFALIQKAYGSWAGQVATVKIPKEPEQRRTADVTLHWTKPTLPLVLVGFHAPSLGTDVKAAAIQNLLGPYLFGPASALYKSLVLDQHLAVGMGSWYGDHREPCLFDFSVTAKDEKSLQPIQDAVAQAISQLQQQGPDPKLLEDVKSNQHYARLMELETPAAIAGALAIAAAPTGDPGSLETLAKAMSTVTAADVQAFAQKYLNPKNETVVVLKPPAATASAGGGQ